MNEYSYFPIKKGQIIVDLGAGRGRSVEFFSKKVGPHGLVIAVEPIYENYRIIIDRIWSKNLVNIVPIMMAMWDDVELHSINVSNEWYRNSIVFKRDKVRSTITISWNVLVGICKLDHVDLAKIDIEGGEIQVLSGMTHILPNKLIIEEHLRYEKDPKQTLNEIFGLLKHRGYKYVHKGMYIYAERRNDKKE